MNDPGYLQQDSGQTLRQAIEEYYRCNPDLLDPEGLHDDIRQLFRQHDAGHVVFGCDTSIRGETLIDTWTVFGSTAGLKGYMEYFRHNEVNDIFRGVGYLTIFAESVKCLPAACLVIIRGMTMNPKWPWAEYEQYLDQPLDQLRAEFNIRVV